MTMGHSIGKCSATFGLYFAFIAICYPVFGEHGLEIKVAAKGEIGSDADFNCTVFPETADLQWIFKEQTINENNRTKLITKIINLKDKDTDGNIRKKKWLRMIVNNVTDVDAGNYACVAKLGDKVTNKSVFLDLSFKGRLVNKTIGPLRLNASKPDDIHVMMYCLFEVYEKPEEVRWYKKDETDKPQSRLHRPVGLKQINSTYDLRITAEENGTYVCEIDDKVTNKYIQGEIDIFVYDKPKIVSFNAIPVSTTQIYINWTVNTYNSPIEMYSFFIREGPASSNSIYSQYRIATKYTSYVIDGLKKSTEYQLKLEVKTPGWYATGLWMDTNVVKTLDKEPVFVPNITINGFSATSVTIGWPPPPEDIADLIHYYILEARKDSENESHKTDHPRDSRNLPYVFGHLDPHSTYVFRVRACSEYTKKCGPWSEEMMAATLDRIPGKPSNVHFSYGEGYMNISWIPL